jgi:transcriptional regulator with XRE-family HTH domain
VLRLGLGLTQSQLAARAGMPLPTYKVFERSGRISLDRMLAVVEVLGRSAEWADLLRPTTPKSLDDVAPARPLRQRGRRGGASS